jgi:hypothetical protein
MRQLIMVAGLVFAVAACGQSQPAPQNNAATASSTAGKKPAYCFFKDSETKDWKAKLDKSGSVVVSGKAYRQDSRYKAILSPAVVTGTSAEVAPTITVNDGAFGAPSDWWEVSQTIPNSEAITTVVVKCGDKTVATLAVPRKKGTPGDR